MAGGKPGGKPDPKKDPKAAPKKGAPVEDKNAPKPIVVDYPEIPSSNNFVILEKTFTQMKQQLLLE